MVNVRLVYRNGRLNCLDGRESAEVERTLVNINSRQSWLIKWKLELKGWRVELPGWKRECRS